MSCVSLIAAGDGNVLARLVNCPVEAVCRLRGLSRLPLAMMPAAPKKRCCAHLRQPVSGAHKLTREQTQEQTDTEFQMNGGTSFHGSKPPSKDKLFSTKTSTA
jgi:hypothetical protein